jgi:antitoxin HigA-1
MTRREWHPTHPGKVLAEEIEARGITGAALARALGIPQNRVSEILNGKRAVTVDTALRLARWTGSTPEFWLNLQQRYDRVTTRERIGEEIERAVTPDSSAHVASA